MGRLNLYFLRHGQTWFNVFFRLQGWANSQLTEKGIEVAKRVGREFADIDFEAVYSSDLGRALETGEIFLAQREGKQPQISPRKGLREIGFGYFEGQDGRSVWNLAEHRAREMYSLPEETVISERMKIDMVNILDPYHVAESFRGFNNRLKECIEEIVSRHAEGNVLIVSHSSAIKAIFENLDKNFEAKEEIANGSISLMCYEEGIYRVKGLNIFNVKELENVL